MREINRCCCCWWLMTTMKIYLEAVTQRQLRIGVEAVEADRCRASTALRGAPPPFAISLCTVFQNHGYLTWAASTCAAARQQSVAHSPLYGVLGLADAGRHVEDASTTQTRISSGCCTSSVGDHTSTSTDSGHINSKSIKQPNSNCPANHSTSAVTSTKKCN